MSISNYLENKILDKVFKDTTFSVSACWVSLHTSDCGETGANECTGGSYGRKSATFDSAASGATANSGNLTWTNMPAGDVQYVGVWDAETTGNFLWGGALTVPKTLNAGDTFQINTGDLDITLD